MKIHLSVWSDYPDGDETPCRTQLSINFDAELDDPPPALSTALNFAPEVWRQGPDGLKFISRQMVYEPRQEVRSCLAEILQSMTPNLTGDNRNFWLRISRVPVKIVGTIKGKPVRVPVTKPPG